MVFRFGFKRPSKTWKHFPMNHFWQVRHETLFFSPILGFLLCSVVCWWESVPVPVVGKAKVRHFFVLHPRTVLRRKGTRPLAPYLLLHLHIFAHNPKKWIETQRENGTRRRKKSWTAVFGKTTRMTDTTFSLAVYSSLVAPTLSLSLSNSLFDFISTRLEPPVHLHLYQKERGMKKSEMIRNGQASVSSSRQGEYSVCHAW